MPFTAFYNPFSFDVNRALECVCPVYHQSFQLTLSSFLQPRLVLSVLLDCFVTCKIVRAAIRKTPNSAKVLLTNVIIVLSHP
jgi:hypothetical protein